MIIMKKKYKIIIPIALVLIVALIVTIIVVSVKRSEKLNLLVLQKHYSLLYEDKPTLNVSVYSNKDNNYYLDQNNIDKSFIYNDTDSYATQVLSFTKQENTLNYKDKTYTENVISFKLDVDSNNLINIENAKAKIVYQNNDVLDLSLGNISFKKTDTTDNINVSKVQSIVTSFDNYTSLAGILLKLNSEKEVVIKNITPISSSLKINYNYCLVKNSDYEVQNNVDLKELFGDSYTPFNHSTTGFNELTLNGEAVIVLPLTYMTNEFVDNCGLVIEYVMDDVTYFEIVNPYVLFKTADNSCFIYEYKPIKN